MRFNQVVAPVVAVALFLILRWTDRSSSFTSKEVMQTWHAFQASPHALVETLRAGRPVPMVSTGGPFNMTMCALTTGEDEFLDEWIAYHRLIGIQQFYLYDTMSHASTAEVLAPYIDQGVVVLHHMNFKDNQTARGFHGRFLHHCTRTYANRTDWLAHIDVDEYMHFSPPLYSPQEPFQDDDARWVFPLQIYLRRRPFVAARCVVLSRTGVYKSVTALLSVVALFLIGYFVCRNVGVRETLSEPLIDQQTWRMLRNVEGGFSGKVLVRTAYKEQLAKFKGAHECTTKDITLELPGIIPPTNPMAIVNPQGLPNPGVDPLMPEPIRVHHYGQRTLKDCHVKLDNIVDRGKSWRFSHGGAEWCLQNYFPIGVPNPDGSFDELEQPRLEPILIEDRGLAESWTGRAASYVARTRARRMAPSAPDWSTKIVKLYL